MDEIVDMLGAEAIETMKGGPLIWGVGDDFERIRKDKKEQKTSLIVTISGDNGEPNL